MQDIASIGFSVDTSQLKKGQVELDKLAKSGSKTEGAVDKFGNSLSKADVAMGRFIDSSGRMREANGRFVAGMGQAEDSTKKTTASLINMATVITALASSMAVSQIVQYSDAWTGAQNQLRMVTDSTEELTGVTEELMKVANGTRSSFEATSTLYSRLARSTTELNLSQSDLLGLVTTINQSFATSGATVAEASAAITQLSQGLAAGTLRGDEFNSVSEAAPGIMRAIADSLRMTIGELRAFAAEGGITAEIVVNALKGAAGSIENDFGKSIATFSQNTIVAKNNLLQFVGSSETVASVVTATGDIIVGFSENLDTAANVALAAGAGIAAYTVATKGATAATAALNVVMSINPLVALARVAGIAAVALGTYAAASYDAEGASRNLKREVKALSGAYEGLTETQLANEMARLAVELQKVAIENKSVADQTKAANDQFANSVGLLGGVGIQTTKTATATAGLSEKELALKAALHAVGKQYELLKKAKKEDEVVTTTSGKKTDDLTKSAKAYLESLKDEVAMFGKSSAEIKQYNALKVAATVAGTELATAIEAEAEELARLTEEQEAAKIATEEFQKAQAEAAKESERLEREYERTFESISDNITDVIMDFENLGSVATSIAKQIARSFLQNQIVNPILGGLGFPGAPSASSSGMNLLSSGSSLLDIGSMFGTAAQGLSYFTAGGASAQQAAMLAAQTGGDAAFGAMTMESLGASGAGAGAGGFAAAIPAAGLAAIAALIITDIFEGSPPKLTFGQGATGQESVAFDVTQSDKGWGVAGDMATGEDVTRSFNESFGAYIETAFGRFGTLDNSFSKKVDEQALDAMFKIVTALDESFASAIGDVSGINLTSRFLPEGSYAGRVDGRNEGETPEEQLINRYSQIIEQALPEAFKQQLMKPDMTLDSIAVGITALDQASTFFGESLAELEQSFKDGALEGETFEVAFGRAIQQATADMHDFIASINGTFSAIAGLSSFATSVREDMMTDDELYKKLKDTADELGASILSLTDPDEITKAVNEYTALSSRAWGLLDESQRAAMGEEFASALDSVIADANSKTQELIEQETQNLSSADAFSASAEAMAQNADKFTSAVDLFVQAVQDMAQSQGVQGFEVTA